MSALPLAGACAIPVPRLPNVQRRKLCTQASEHAYLMRMQCSATLKQFSTAWEVTPVHLKYRNPPLGICHTVDLLFIAAEHGV
jgi:hypothetical protein